MRRLLLVITLSAVAALTMVSTSARRQTTSTWPDRRAYYVAEIVKGADGVENGSYSDVGDRFNNTICNLQEVGSSCNITVVINSADLGPYPSGAVDGDYPLGVYRADQYEGTNTEPPCARTDPEVCLTNPDMSVKYYVRGVAVSGWITYPYNFTLTRNDADMAGLCDGVHDLSLDVQSGTIDDRQYWRYYPMIVQLSLGNTACTTVPSTMREAEYYTYGFGETTMGSRVRYISHADAVFTGYPADPDVFTPWTEAPNVADLYQEEMQPHTEQFLGAPMWWAIPPGQPLAGTPYLRNLGPKWDEHHTALRTTWQQQKFPIKDGPRGVGWTSPYITGFINADDVFYFCENGQGSCREMHPDGELETLVGWKTDPAKHPIYLNESIATIRQNQVLVGDWTSGSEDCLHAGAGGFWSPMDITEDPNNDEIFYVAEFEGNRICKMEEGAGTGGATLVTLFAGSLTSEAGYTNATGSSALFSGPTSLIADPICNCIYVADSKNDAIRKIDITTRAVTTVVGRASSTELLTYYKIAYGADNERWPSYLDFRPVGENMYEYAQPGTTTDADALEAHTGSGDAGRAVGVWYATSTMDLQFNFTGGESHEVSLYFVDWDVNGRSTSIQVLDGVTESVLVGAQTVSSFTSGKYLTWNVTGNVKFRLTKTGGDNLVLAGVFLDPGVAGNSFIGTDTTTRGDWVGVYGADGGKNIGYSIYRGGATDIVDQYHHQASARNATMPYYEVSSGQAAGGARPTIHYPFAIRVASDGDLIWNDVGFGSIRRMDISTYETFEISVMELAQTQVGYYDQTGWSWLDVDRWGNSGPLDGVYFGAFQASYCYGTMTSKPNESYCWAPGDGSAQGINFFNDSDSYPNGWGKVSETDPPHYMWLVAVAPNGGVYLAGGGEHGITRLRKRRAIDPVPSNYTTYGKAERYYWKYGSGMSGTGDVGPAYGTSLMLKFGSECHNYIGMPDCWSIADEVYEDTISDAEIIAMFELDADLLDEGNIDVVVNYIRLNAGPPVGAAPPEPDPPVRRLQMPFRIRGIVEWLLSGLAGPPPQWIWL